MFETRIMSPEAATPEGLAPYGTLIEPGDDGTPFGPGDAMLDLGRGVPRFYIMRLRRRPATIRGITRHRQVTQCLAALKGRDWFLLLAPPDRPDEPETTPDPERIRAFRFSGEQAVALHRGTWHAGPFFLDEEAEFINLELSDTNEADHHTVDLERAFGFVVRLAHDPASG